MKLQKTKKTGKQHNNDLPQFPNVVLCLPFPREKRVGGGRGGGQRVLSLFKDQLSPVKVIASKFY